MLTLNFYPFPVLYTERLVLRQMEESDKGDLFIFRSDKNLMKYIGRPLAESTDDALALIEKINESFKNNEGITWGISLKENPELIGTIGFWRIDKQHHRGEIGYLLSADYQGKKIMQEAIAAALDYAFTVIQLHSIEANVNPLNTASIKLLEKMQFVQEGYFKENFYHDGIFGDSIIFSLLNSIKPDFSQRNVV